MSLGRYFGRARPKMDFATTPDAAGPARRKVAGAMRGA